MQNTLIKTFTIKNLFKERDVSIRFDSNIRILVAENGYGKTTILNTLYYVVTGSIVKLKKVDFSSISISFTDGSKFNINKADLDIVDNAKKNPFYEHLKTLLPKDELDNLITTFLDESASKFKASKIFKSSAIKSNFDEKQLLNYLERFFTKDSSTIFTHKVRKVFADIKEKMPTDILYLPTYRRVEIDLGLNTDSNEETHDQINFGMKDVENLIKARTQEILKSSVEWFSKVNGQMLSQLAEGFSLDDELKESIKKPDAVKIVLDRIGNNIDKSTKQKILFLIASDQIFNNHDPLIYFISNLVKVYEQQRDNDRAIQNFTEVCNRYLGDKMIKYNEGIVSVQVVRRKNETPVELESLSSGEKQIISIFAKLYLQKHNEYAIFFDEPELSLSLEWQRTLLPDIMNSGMCKFLFSTTHSPFIFENEFENFTVDLAEYIKEL
ncbi:AAA family ATPase [Pseudomonas sp. S5D5]|uniref:AAA family ATPase n=1 Tax=Pseudomonas sp. S5D5 TaxID=2083056 RepID=UPI001C443366|nr:AAA family ATPase [Pseudomonas sp. S5D5]